MRHRFVWTILSLLLANFAALRAQTTRYFTFSSNYLPNWVTNDIQIWNCSGVYEYSLFTPNSGLLQQRMSTNANCNAFFYGGALPGGLSSSAGLDRWLPTFVEARLAVVGGVQATTSPGGIPIFWLHTIGRSGLSVDLVAGAVGLQHGNGIAWTVPPGGITAPHTYRIEVQPNGGVPLVTLKIDGVPRLGPLPASVDWIYDGWAFGDGSVGPGDGIDIDWDYFSVSQHTPGIGMANTSAAMLFATVTSPAQTIASLAAPGLAGPFRVTGLSGNWLNLEWSGPPGAPFALLLAPSLGLPRPIGCGDTVDIGTLPGFADIAAVFNPTIPVFGSLFTLSPAGYSQQSLAVPPAAAGSLLGAIQGVVFAPGGCGYKLTAAAELRF